MSTRYDIYSGYDIQYPIDGSFNYDDRYIDITSIPSDASVYIQYKDQTQKISDITNFYVTFSPDETVSFKGTSTTLSWDFKSFNSMGDGTPTEVYVAIYYTGSGGSSGDTDSGSDNPSIDEMISCDIVFSECGLLWLENIRYNTEHYNEYNNYLKKITYIFYNSDRSVLYKKTKSRDYYDYDLEPLLFVDFAHDDNNNITPVPNSVELGVVFEFSGGDKYTDTKYEAYAINLREEIWGKEKIYLDITSAEQKNNAEIDVKYKSYFGVKEYDWIMSEKPSVDIFNAMNGDSGIYLTFSFLHSSGEAIQQYISWDEPNEEHTFTLNAMEIYNNIPSAISGEVSVSTNYWYDLHEPTVDIVCMTKTFTLYNWPSIARFHFKNIADAIREKRKITKSLTIRDMVIEMYNCCNFPIDDYPPENLISGYENANAIECVKMMAKLYRCYLGGGEEVGDTPVKLERIADIIKNIT